MLAVALAAAPAPGAARQSPSLSFFSSGSGAHADWLHTLDQPPGDTDGQAIRVVDTTEGYAGADVKHAEGQPTATYPDSSFDFKASMTGPSLGYPRLHYFFSDGGNAYLRAADVDDDVAARRGQQLKQQRRTCGYAFGQTWSQVQACHAGTIVTEIVFLTDPGIDVEFRVDNLNTAGKVISSASDNER